MAAGLVNTGRRARLDDPTGAPGAPVGSQTFGGEVAGQQSPRSAIWVEAEIPEMKCGAANSGSSAFRGRMDKLESGPIY